MALGYENRCESNVRNLPAVGKEKAVPLSLVCRQKDRQKSREGELSKPCLDWLMQGIR